MQVPASEAETTGTTASTLTGHLEHLAVDAEDLARMLSRSHQEEGDIHPEALAKAAALQTSLRAVIHQLSHHEPLAMKADDVWAALSREHHERSSGQS